MRIVGGCATETGNYRKCNQDAVLFCSREQGRYSFAVGAVCDGIGSFAHSEAASYGVIQKIKEWFEKTAEWIDIETIIPEILFAHLKDEAENWNEFVRDLAIHENGRMGTTLSVLLIIREKYFVIHVGDSRIYLFRRGLQQLTIDESELRISDGKEKKYLANYLGKKEELSFLTAEGCIKKKDLFLFGSDGFWHFFKSEDVKSWKLEKAQASRWDKTCRMVLDVMLARGERDNLSLGMISVVD